MKQNDPSSSNAARIVSVSGLAVFVLGYMLWEIVSAYIAGGSDAPTVGILIAAILVLGGGMVFALYLMIGKGRAFLPKTRREEEYCVSGKGLPPTSVKFFLRKSEIFPGGNVKYCWRNVK